MTDARRQAISEKATSDALNVLWVLSLRSGVEPTPDAVNLLASVLMAFGAEYCLLAFADLLEALDTRQVIY